MNIADNLLEILPPRIAESEAISRGKRRAMVQANVGNFSEEALHRLYPASIG